MSHSFKAIICNSTEMSEKVVDLPTNLRYTENSKSIPVPAAKTE